jgi:hypothetical protein
MWVVSCHLPRWSIYATTGVAILAISGLPHAQSTPNVEQLLARLGDRIAEYYQRVRDVICIERSVVQPIGLSYTPDGFARTVESELRIEAESDDARDGIPNVLRHIRRVNGRLPDERDKKNRSGCTDPEPLSIEPLAFLLPGRRDEYEFVPGGLTKERNRDVVMINFWTANRKSSAVLIEDKYGHDDCFDWSGHIATQGRIWIDAASYDVIRIEKFLRGPVDVRVPTAIQRRHHLDGYVTLQRDDITIRYRSVSFTDPEDVIMLPESIDSVTLVRGGLQSTRRSQTFSEYKRFLTGGRVTQN